MIRDCRAGTREGWIYFVSQYVPVLRKLLLHYTGSDEELDRILRSLRRPGANLFQSLEPSPERPFLAELRQHALRTIQPPAPDIPLDLETVAAALAGLTVVEKQAAWLETLRYDAQQTGTLLRISPETVKKIREKAGELIRGRAAGWRTTILLENGMALGREADAARGEDCLPAKIFLDMLDGRTNWGGREALESHVSECWHCIDHFCRLVEVLDLVRGVKPLTEQESARYFDAVGVEAADRPVWRRWLGTL
jgi:hypothetical protein